MSAKTGERSPTERLYDVAERQAGYFTTAQAREVGFSQRQLTYYVRSGHHRRVRRGIYRLALYPSSPHEDLFVAWLEAGRNAVISHESALMLHELSDALPDRVHVTIPRGASRRHPRLALHTSRLDPQEVTALAGLPVTTVPRTIADVAARGLAEQLILQAVQQAVRRGLVRMADLQDYARSRGNRLQRLVAQALQELVG